MSAQHEPSKRQPLFSVWRDILSWMMGLRTSSGIPLDDRNIRRLADCDENENIEFKQRLLSYKEIAEYAVGIGNAGGGLLLMGISDKRPRKLVGLPELKQDDIKKIQLSVHNSASIRVMPQSVKTQDGLCILGIEMPARPRGQVLCTQDGKYLILKSAVNLALFMCKFAQKMGIWSNNLCSSRPSFAKVPKYLQLSSGFNL